MPENLHEQPCDCSACQLRRITNFERDMAPSRIQEYSIERARSDLFPLRLANENYDEDIPSYGRNNSSVYNFRVPVINQNDSSNSISRDEWEIFSDTSIRGNVEVAERPLFEHDKKCYFCSTKKDIIVHLHDMFFCEDCYHNEPKKFLLCPCCFEYLPLFSFSTSTPMLICSKCLIQRYATCVKCAGFFSLSSNPLCPICRETTNICISCGCWYPKNEMECIGCLPDTNPTKIHMYNYIPRDLYHFGSENNLPYGIEAEIEIPIDKKTETRRFFKDLSLYKNKPFCYLKNDGSLVHGFEIVSHPADLSSHKDFQWSKVFNKLKRHGIKSDSCESCGFHIHIDESFFSSTDKAKLALAIFNNQEFFETIGRRKANHYCHFGPSEWRTDQITHLNNYNNKYFAINFLKPETIEFRFFQGTINPDILYFNLDIIEVLVQLIKTNTVDDLAIKNSKEQPDKKEKFMNKMIKLSSKENVKQIIKLLEKG